MPSVFKTRIVIVGAFVLAAAGMVHGQAEGGIEEVIVPADASAAVIVVGGSTKATPAAEKSDEDKAIERLRKERELIAAENSLAQEKLRQELFSLESEKQRLTLANGLRRERLESEVAGLRTELDRLQIELDRVNRQAAIETATRRNEMERELALMRGEEERLKLANAVAAQKLESRLSEMRVQDTELKIQRAQLDLSVVQLQTDISVREKRDVLRDLVPADQIYTTTPFQDGVLRISDRRVALNGIIAASMAEDVVERIDYFNNQNTEYPIFLVIDASPGGSVMAGSRILKAMEGSQAPVYVVVKSYAASMAAVITTLAPRSFAYPNAVILHHQISWLGMGNLTQQKEQMELREQWWRRLAQPVAARMGVTLDQFIAQMYQKNSDGDWREFGDKARELKWVGEVVHTIWETSQDKNPDRFGSRSVVAAQLEESVDQEGNPYVVLPRLAPMDCYFVHNPDRYYRLR